MGVTALILATEVARHDPDYAGTPVVGNPTIVYGTADDEEGGMPASLVIEHGDLHASLAAAAHLGGATGMAAVRVEELMSDHFQKRRGIRSPRFTFYQ